MPQLSDGAILSSRPHCGPKRRSASSGLVRTSRRSVWYHGECTNVVQSAATSNSVFAHDGNLWSGAAATRAMRRANHSQPDLLLPFLHASSLAVIVVRHTLNLMFQRGLHA